MIKIIKNTLAEPTSITCPICESIFSFTFEDIRRDEISNIFDICGKKTVKRFVVCPVCKSDIDLGAKVVYKANLADVIEEGLKNE